MFSPGVRSQESGASSGGIWSLLTTDSWPLAPRLAEALLAFLDRHVDVLLEVLDELVERHLVAEHLLEVLVPRAGEAVERHLLVLVDVRVVADRLVRAGELCLEDLLDLLLEW